MLPILDSLNKTQHEWLKKLLFTFNEGNIGKFEALAPLFPKEVWSLVGFFKFCTYLCFPAHPPRKLRFPSTKDLSDGSHRVGI